MRYNILLMAISISIPIQKIFLESIINSFLFSLFETGTAHRLTRVDWYIIYKLIGIWYEFAEYTCCRSK